jgi:hypothetical protein
MKKGNRGILIFLYGITAVIFIAKGLLCIYVQDFLTLGCIYFAFAFIFALGLLWSVVQLVVEKKK